MRTVEKAPAQVDGQLKEIAVVASKWPRISTEYEMMLMPPQILWRFQKYLPGPHYPK